MSDDLFDGCWQRLERANIAEPDRVVQRIPRPAPYDYTVIDNRDGTYVIRVTQGTAIPAKLGVLIGEWLYNLRATLDTVIWATAAYVAGAIPHRGSTSSSTRSTTPDEEPIQAQRPGRAPSADAPPDAALQQRCGRQLPRLDQPPRARRPAPTPQRHDFLHTDLRPVVGLPPGTQANLQFGDRIIDDDTADCVRLSVRNWTPDMVVAHWD